MRVRYYGSTPTMCSENFIGYAPTDLQCCTVNGVLDTGPLNLWVYSYHDIAPIKPPCTFPSKRAASGRYSNLKVKSTIHLSPSSLRRLRMSTIPPNFNYAAAIGIYSLPAAIVFTVLYVLLFGVFLGKSFTHPTYVHYVLTFFCLSKFPKTVSFHFQNSIWLIGFSSSRRVCHTRRFSRFGSGGRVNWIGYCGSNPF